MFYNHENIGLIIKGEANITANDLIKQNDLYVVNKEFTWSYVVSHEKEEIGTLFLGKEFKNLSKIENLKVL